MAEILVVGNGRVGAAIAFALHGVGHAVALADPHMAPGAVLRDDPGFRIGGLDLVNLDHSRVVFVDEATQVEAACRAVGAAIARVRGGSRKRPVVMFCTPPANGVVQDFVPYLQAASGRALGDDFSVGLLAGSLPGTVAEGGTSSDYLLVACHNHWARNPLDGLLGFGSPVAFVPMERAEQVAREALQGADQ